MSESTTAGANTKSNLPNNPSIDETLEKTDFGSFVNTNKKPILVFFALILIGIVLITIFKYNAEQSEKVALSKAYTIQKEVFTPYLKDKIKLDAFEKKVKSLEGSTLEVPTLIPPVLEASDKLTKDKRSDLAIYILEAVLKEQGKSNLDILLFVKLKLAVLYENNGKTKEALDLYKEMASKKESVISSKIYLSLGRLHSKLKNTEQASRSFQYIIDNFSDTDEARLAKIYLKKLNL